MKRTASGAVYAGKDDLKFYIHDDGAAAFRFEIEGSLSGTGALELEQAWRTACSIIGNRTLVIGVGNLTGIDPFGRALLRRWHDAGARFVTRSPLVKMLVGSITGQPPISAAGSHKHNRWLWLRAAVLKTNTSKAWEEYGASANMRMEQRLRPDKTFLWVDEVPGRLASVRAGGIVVSPVGPQNPKRAPSGLIHDWVGAAFIPGVTLNDVLQVVRDYAFLKTAFETDYESCYVHVDQGRAYSVARTTRIQEIEEYGAPVQRMLQEGDGNGLIWRLFSLARYVERDGGVYLELEAIGLSRDIPASLRWLVAPIVRRISRGSLSTSLRQTRDAVRFRVESANRKTESQTRANGTVAVRLGDSSLEST